MNVTNKNFKIMKSRKNQLKSAFTAVVLCLSLLFFNSCQTSEEEIVFAPSELFTKDSKIVPLFLKAVGGNMNTNNSKNLEMKSSVHSFYTR